MKRKFLLIFSILFLLKSFVFAGEYVDTLSVHSEKMQVNVETVVILPDDYSVDVEYPVLYLLHGYDGNARQWLNIKPSLSEKASEYQMIIVCPDAKNSWYWDSPTDSKSQYETFISHELVNYIDTRYSTLKVTEGRAIAGLSMGGHGALWLAIRYQNIFGACGSMSGGLDIRPFPDSWNLKVLLGNLKDNSSVWDSHTVINLVDKISPASLAMIVDCGTSDFFYKVNQDFHNKLLSMNIQHDYIVRPGGHDYNYWNNAIDYQLLFFHKFFDKVKHD